jgi:hypothetical protein
MNEGNKWAWAWFFAPLAVYLVVSTTYAQQPINVAQVGGASPVQSICDDAAKTTSININLTAGTGNTEIVPLSGTTVIYVCAYKLIVGGADGTQWIYGTGTACATGETDLDTSNFSAAGDGAGETGGGNLVLFRAPSGKALCIERTNSVTLSGRVTYAQF